MTPAPGITRTHSYSEKHIAPQPCSYLQVFPTDPNHGNPMVKLVAVLQEFLLFQSDAKVLTHSTLVGMYPPNHENIEGDKEMQTQHEKRAIETEIEQTLRPRQDWERGTNRDMRA